MCHLAEVTHPQVGTYGHLHVAMCEQKNAGKGAEIKKERGPRINKIGLYFLKC